VTLVDLDRMEVVEVEDHAVVPLPTHDGNYTAAALATPRNVPHVPAGPRADLRRLEITQPEGPSFQLSGHELTWQKWRLRTGLHPRAVPGADLRSLEITQPEGPSFQLSGHELTWQKWRLRIGFTPREGLVLYTV